MSKPQRVIYEGEGSHYTRLEIDLDAMAHNFRVYKSLLRPETKLLVMVKANAYGNGSYFTAKLLEEEGADMLGVAYADEGVSLREKGIQLPILVFSPHPDDLSRLVENDLQTEIYSFRMLEALEAVVRKKSIQQMSVHIKFDTGMSRLGFEPGEAQAVAERLKALPNVEVAGLLSHLSSADMPEEETFTQGQIDVFKQLADVFEQAYGQTVTKHLLNTPGILSRPEAQFEMVRLGVGLYGVDPNEELQGRLKHVGTLKTVVQQVRDLPAGASVGYGRKGRAEKPMRVAVLAIGYADGFPRALGNGVGGFLIGGKRAPVVGNVCMDMTMADVTGLDVSEGDEAIAFGEGLTIGQRARELGTIPYEVMTNVGERVRRVFLRS